MHNYRHVVLVSLSLKIVLNWQYVQYDKVTMKPLMTFKCSYNYNKTNRVFYNGQYNNANLGRWVSLIKTQNMGVLATHEKMHTINF